jgi:hypothetical protein
MVADRPERQSGSYVIRIIIASGVESNAPCLFQTLDVCSEIGRFLSGEFHIGHPRMRI